MVISFKNGPGIGGKNWGVCYNVHIHWLVFCTRYRTGTIAFGRALIGGKRWFLSTSTKR